MRDTHSISAGLDYPGVGPEHAFLSDSGRATYVSATDEEALAAYHHTARTEGIVPALESSHAIAYAIKLARELGPDGLILVSLSGRGDKDVRTGRRDRCERAGRGARVIAADDRLAARLQQSEGRRPRRADHLSRRGRSRCGDDGAP